jgi:hypothetical protein
MRIGIVSIQRDRGRWLPEWLAFHHLMGVSRFYVYAHRCTDDTAQVLTSLSRTYAIQSFEVKTQEDRVQLKVYQHAYEQFGHECDWLAFLDGDEFLFPTEAATLPEAMAVFDYLKVSAIGVYWACFGSSGHVSEPEGLITQNFRRRAADDFEANRHVKSIVRGRQTCRVGPNSHLFQTPWGTQDEQGRPITFGLTDHHPSWERLRINHYVCQSLQYFREFKQRSGAADAGAAHIRPDDWWTRHDRNEIEDDSVLRFQAALEAEMRRIAPLLIRS